MPDVFLGRIYTYGPVAWPQRPLRGVALGSYMRRDMVDGGGYQISGATVNTGSPEIPVGRRVRLHDQPSGRVVAEVWSDPVTGAYAFTNIRQGLYYITSFDHTGQYNGVVQTDVTAEPMP